MVRRLYHGRFPSPQRVLESAPVTEEAPVLERFAALLRRVRPATGAVALGDIVDEAAPALELLAELPPAPPEGGSFDSFEFRECLTVLSLLGRRLALLDLTPTTTAQVVELALRAVSDTPELQLDGFARRAIASTFEGFVMGREERVAESSVRRGSKPIRPLRIDANAFALIISGAHPPQVLSDSVDALGRAMLDANVETAIVDLTQLGEPSAERAAAIFAAEEVTRMLGGVCLFTGVDPRWEAAAARARIALGEMHVVPSLAEALQTARETAGPAGGGDTRTWRALLDRLRR